MPFHGECCVSYTVRGGCECRKTVSPWLPPPLPAAPMAPAARARTVSPPRTPSAFPLAPPCRAIPCHEKWNNWEYRSWSFKMEQCSTSHSQGGRQDFDSGVYFVCFIRRREPAADWPTPSCYLTSTSAIPPFASFCTKPRGR